MAKTQYPSLKPCAFCDFERRNNKITGRKSVFAIWDQFPVTSGHALIIPNRHTPDFFTMTSQERHEAEEVVFELRENLLKKEPSILGFNIGMNCGEAAGQTIMHAHIHLIPRREGDVENPVGGIRRVIDGKGRY